MSPDPRPASPRATDVRICRVVQRIPPGKVATYGQVASLAGLAGQARRVGRALRILGESAGVPWHRVVNAQGRISLTRVDPGSAAIQRLRLLDEGVRFDRNGRVDLEACRWRP